MRQTHRALADLLEDLRARVFCDVVRHLEEAESSGSLRMDDALWNAFAIEMRHLVDVVDILEQDGAALADGQRSSLHANRGSMSESCNSRSVLKIS